MSARAVWFFALSLALGVAACTAQDRTAPAPAPAPGTADVAGGLDAGLLAVRLGGMTTAFKDQADAFGFPARNIHPDEDIAFAAGADAFNRTWPADAVGPRFDATSCAACHLNHGRGVLGEDLAGAAASPGAAPPTDGLLVKLRDVHRTGDAGTPVGDPVLGGQLQQRAVAGVAPEGTVEVAWDEQTGSYGDGTVYTLRRPRLTLRDLLAPLQPDVRLSPRLAPPVIGAGLLEAVPDGQLEALADPDDRDGDGVRGRRNIVRDARTGASASGRFGWKAGQPTVADQAAAALAEDMGVEPGEVDPGRRRALVVYTQLLAVPAGRGGADPRVRDGAGEFVAMGCSACHVPTLRTGDAAIGGLGHQEIHPYTDLLVHDMGDGLADGTGEYGAGPRDWRTPPLWGLGLTEVVTGPGRYLHDGRARTLEEAVLWHGGEAEAARERFRTADRARRDALIAYLRSR